MAASDSLRKGEATEATTNFENFGLSYRPLCLLNDMGKLFERATAGDLSDLQLQIRKAGFTLNAISTVTKTAEAPNSCALVALDVLSILVAINLYVGHTQ